MNLEVNKGNDKTLNISVVDSDANIIDLTNGVLTFRVQDWQEKQLFTKTSTTTAEIEITDATGGLASIYIIPGDTSAQTAGMYIFYINFTNAAGKIYTINQGEFQIIDAGSTMYVRNRIRNFAGDKSELNVLIQAIETTDAEMNDYITKAIENFNGTGFLTTYTLQDYPNISNLIDGTIIQILSGKGILSARNMLTYRDTGGVSVEDFDTYGRYVNLFNLFITKYHNQVLSIKRSINMDSAYGDIESPLSNYEPIGYY